MIPGKMKNFLFVVGFLILALVLEYVRRRWGIPVTILDLLLFPGALIFTVLFLRDFFSAERKKIKDDKERIGGRAVAGRIAAALLLFLPLGGWCVWAGLRSPLDYFSGVKGAAHGYTLAAVGLLVLSIAVMLIASVLPGFRKNS